MKAIKIVVSEFNKLCKLSNYKEAGELARNNKDAFIKMIVDGTNVEMLYAYRVCEIFNMRQTDCFNLKY